MIHPTALVESRAVGPGTRVWAFTHILDGAVIGQECNIGEHCYIERGAVIGDRATIKNHVAIWDGVRIENDVFIGPHASLTNDARPRSHNAHWVLMRTLIKQGATLGANATILPGLTIGAYAFVGAGAVVIQSVPAFAIVVGNPSRQTGWVCRCAASLHLRRGRATCVACRLRYVEERGRLRCLGRSQRIGW